MEKSIKLKKGDILKNRYCIESGIGKGGIGYTYLAEDREEKIHLVLKVLYLSELRNWKELELFKREIKVLKNINHPQIPKYHNSFETEINNEKLFVLAQEYVNGEDLYKQIKSGNKFSLEEVKEIFESLLKTINYIHTLQIPVIHRDINPKNIIKDNNNNIYLVDFGATGMIRDNTSAAAMSDTFVGTIGYMPPEQLFGKASPSSDLYSLGATIIFLLTGKEPAEFELDKMRLDYHGFVKIPVPLRNLLDRMINPDVKTRINSARKVLGILKNIIIIKPGTKKIIKVKSYKKGTPKNELDRDKVVRAKAYKKLISAIKADDFNNTLKAILGGADLNKKDRAGFMPLHYACNCEGKKQYLTSLTISDGAKFQIKSGAKVIIGPDSGAIPLKIARLLVICGVDIKALDNSGKAALDYAKQFAVKELIEFLESIQNLNPSEIEALLKSDKEVKSVIQMLFIQAGTSNDISYLKRAILLGADIKKKGGAVLINAVSSNNYDTAEYLFENGAELKSLSKKSTPLLFIALKKNNLKMTKLLLENGEDIDVKYKGRSGLHTAVLDNNIKQVSFLIEYGAFLDMKDEDNKTAIEHAFKKGYTEIEKLLIDYGAEESSKYVIRNRLKNISPPPRKVAFDIRFFLKWQPGNRAITIIFFILVVVFLLLSESESHWLESIQLLLGENLTAEGIVYYLEDGMVSYEFGTEGENIRDSSFDLFNEWEQGRTVTVYYLRDNPEISRVSGTSNMKWFDFLIIMIPMTLIFIFSLYKSRTKKGKKINRIKVLKKGKIADASVINNKEITYEWYKCFYKYVDDDKEAVEDFDYIKSNLSKTRGLHGESLPLLYIRTKQKIVSLLTDTLIKEMGVKSKIVCRKGKWSLKPEIIKSNNAFIFMLFRYLLSAGIGFSLLLCAWNILLVVLGI